MKYFYWLAINGPTVVMSSIPGPRPNITPVPEALVGFPVQEEAEEMMAFLLSAPIEKCLKQMEDWKRRSDLAIIFPPNPEPFSAHTAWSWELIDANELNRTAVFDSLTTLGITAVQVEFDGYGDSGQIESTTAFSGEASTELGDAVVQAYNEAREAGRPLTVTSTPLREAIEDLCYAFLEQEHEGWEIDDGGNGRFEFNVAERAITLSITKKYSEYFENEL